MSTPLHDKQRVVVDGLLRALLEPMVTTMRRGGIDRMSIERDGSVLLQMQTGEVIGPLEIETVKMSLKEFSEISESIL